MAGLLRLRALASQSHAIVSLRDICKALSSSQGLQQMPVSLSHLNLLYPSEGQLAASSRRSLHWSSAVLATLQVKVPALGESITDGTISAVLKSPGDHIEEDEPIVQIETDKVTIDVRSPCSGTVDVILVKPDDNVSVNHVVAAIIQGEAPAKAEGTAPPVHASSSSSITSTTTSSATPTVAGGSGDHHHGYRPRISFPPRRTPQGDIISMMPREQAQQALQSLGASHGAKSTIVSPSAPQSAQPTQQPQRRIIPSSAEGPPLPRKTMSEAEIEAIMLGGAM